MSFKTDLITKRDMSRDFCWILTEDLVYENDKYIITVKIGFDFDFASIPWLFRRVLPKNGQKYDRGSCLHDGLYAAQALPKDECDDLFKEANLSDGTNSVVANTMHTAVRCCGNSAYNDDEDIEKYKELIVVVTKEKVYNTK